MNRENVPMTKTRFKRVYSLDVAKANHTSSEEDGLQKWCESTISFCRYDVTNYCCALCVIVLFTIGAYALAVVAMYRKVSDDNLCKVDYRGAMNEVTQREFFDLLHLYGGKHQMQPPTGVECDQCASDTIPMRPIWIAPSDVCILQPTLSQTNFPCDENALYDHVKICVSSDIVKRLWNAPACRDAADTSLPQLGYDGVLRCALPTSPATTSSKNDGKGYNLIGPVLFNIGLDTNGATTTALGLSNLHSLRFRLSKIDVTGSVLQSDPGDSYSSSPGQAITMNDLHSHWYCYLGRPVIASGAIVGEQNRLFYAGRDLYQTSQSDIINYPLIRNADEIWLGDPTAGMQNYMYGCMDKSALVTQQELSNITLHASTGYWNRQAHIYSESPGPSANLETLRLESNKLYDSTAIFMLTMYNVPHTGGDDGNSDAAWPAFWMLGVPNPNSWLSQAAQRNWISLGSTWPFLGSGEVDFFETAGCMHSGRDGTCDDHKHRFVTLHAPSTCKAKGTLNKIPWVLGTCVAGEWCDCQFGLSIPKGQRCVTGEYDSTCASAQYNGCGMTIPMGTDASWKTQPYTYLFGFFRTNCDHTSPTKPLMVYPTPSNMSTLSCGVVTTISYKASPGLPDSVASWITRLDESQSQQNLYTDNHGHLKIAGMDAIYQLLVTLGNSLNLQYSKTMYKDCEGVFPSMRPIINTAVCGQWGGRTLVQRDQCSSDVFKELKLTTQDLGKAPS